MSLSSGDITKDALLIFKAANYRVRRVNNTRAFKNRGVKVEKGWPDIQGYDRKGRVLLCEVKAEGDDLSDEQEERLLDCDSCGGIALVAIEKSGQTVLLTIKEYLK